MGIYEILRRSAEKKDASEYIAVLDEDYEFYRHQTGTTMNKEKISIMLDSMMSNPEVVIREIKSFDAFPVIEIIDARKGE